MTIPSIKWFILYTTKKAKYRGALKSIFLRILRNSEDELRDQPNWQMFKELVPYTHYPFGPLYTYRAVNTPILL
jgi:hypothetical protein